jgi:dipeptide transport system ATP-binding protein
MEFNGLDLLTISDEQRRKIVRRDIAMIFQEPMTSLNPCFTVGFQIGETLKTHFGMDKKAQKKRSIELLEQVGITDPEKRLSAYPHQLSGGMSQRVMIAMALSSEPKLLIADEPTTALDVTIQAQILDLLLRLRHETGMGLVLITHDMGVVAETAQRVVVQYAGQQVEMQDTRGLFRDPHHPYTASLLSAAPTLDGRVAERIRLDGEIPSAIDLP